MPSSAVEASAGADGGVRARSYADPVGAEAEDRYEDLVDELVGTPGVGAGEGVRFDANKGTPMKEWFSLDPESGLPWPPLAREALEFARSGRAR